MDDFIKAVEDGLKLAKRICNTKDRYTPPRPAGMERSPLESLKPTAPMVYAVIYDPATVDNPDVPSYQPHVYGRMDPPALIPLQMNEIAAEVECYLDTAFVTVRGSWRVHCVMGSRSCDCRLVVPMGEQGSMLGVEVDVSKRSYSTQVIEIEENQNFEKTSKNEGGLLEAQMFFLTIPQVDGGSILSFKIRWSQKLLYNDGQFSIGIPFSFPEYVNPPGKLISKKEMIVLNVDTGTGKEVLCKITSHALKETRRQLGTLSFLYKAEVITWSTADFHFSYTVYSSDIFGGVLLQSPSVHDFDQREMFCLYLYPGNNQHRKVLRKEVVFVVDISESMRERPLENAINALCAALSDLAPWDSFSIIAFNAETCTFSSSLELATEEMVENATHWISKNCVASGGSNILRPLNEAMDMFSKSRDSVPHIFLVTDGAVEDERNVCCTMRTYMTSGRPIAPRISTFGIGSYCNHFFLRMLATIGRGYYDAAFDADSIEVRLKRFYRRAFSPIFVNITVDILDHLDAYEVYPSHIPDLFFEMPLIISGRYHGNFPETLKAKGIKADMTISEIDLKVQKIKDIPLDKVLAKQQIDLMTAQAWFSESKFFKEKVIKLSIQNGIVSEYTRMILLQSVMPKLSSVQEVKKMDLQKHLGSKDHKQALVPGLSIGFGNVIATSLNLPTGFGQVKTPESSAVLTATVNCCSGLADCCCCMCFIKVCSKMSDQFVLVMTQLCTALSFVLCFECCAEVCCDRSE